MFSSSSASRRFRRLTALTALAFASFPAAFAQLVLDADHQAAGPVNGGIVNSDRLSEAQTFTVENTGWITRIELLVGAQRSGVNEPLAPLRLDLRTLTGGLPSNANAGANILGTSSHAAADIPTYSSAPLSWVSFDFAPVAVTAGESLAFAVTSPASGGGYEYVVGAALAWPGIGAPAGTYAGGQAYRRWTSGDTLPWEGVAFSSGGQANDPANVDLYFRVWVDTTPPVAAAGVPEPRTWGVWGGAALLGLLAARRGRA